MTPSGEPTLRFWVPGHPRTKGSLDIIPGKRCTCCRACQGYVGMPRARDSANSKRWRELMAYQARAAMHGRTLSESGFLIARDRRIAVLVEFALPVQEVITARAGDIDKLYRNALDALQDARVYEDDVQVVWLGGEKFEGSLISSDVGGMGIQVWAL